MGFKFVIFIIVLQYSSYDIQILPWYLRKNPRLHKNVICWNILNWYRKDLVRNSCKTNINISEYGEVSFFKINDYFQKEIGGLQMADFNFLKCFIVTDQVKIRVPYKKRYYVLDELLNCFLMSNLLINLTCTKVHKRIVRR